MYDWFRYFRNIANINIMEGYIFTQVNQPNPFRPILPVSKQSVTNIFEYLNIQISNIKINKNVTLCFQGNSMCTSANPVNSLFRPDMSGQLGRLAKLDCSNFLNFSFYFAFSTCLCSTGWGNAFPPTNPNIGQESMSRKKLLSELSGLIFHVLV